MTNQLEQEVAKPHRGNPSGTYFAVGALVVLLVLVGIYGLVSHGIAAKNAPTPDPSATHISGETTTPRPAE